MGVIRAASLLDALDEEDEFGAFLVGGQDCVTRARCPGRDVRHRARVSRNRADDAAYWHVVDVLSDSHHRKRAEQALEIELKIDLDVVRHGGSFLLCRAPGSALAGSHPAQWAPGSCWPRDLDARRTCGCDLDEQLDLGVLSLEQEEADTNRVLHTVEIG